MYEFNLIKKYFAELSPKRSDVLLSIGDDCALLKPRANEVLAVTMDTLVAGVHFFPDMPAYDLGYKALAVNLSDLAAMGAEPAWATLALTLPKVDDNWLTEFCAGFSALGQQYQLQLVGGDTTQGPLSITVQAHGFVPAQQALRRDSAKPGDKIYVTGSLGDAGAGLLSLKKQLKIKDTLQQQLINRLYKPAPRVKEGMALRGIANAAIDISDGLAADLGHILELSQVGARIYPEQLPLSSSLKQAVDLTKAWELALTAGDDYELCFTVPAKQESKLKELNLACTCIGRIEKIPGLHLQLSSAETYSLPGKLGYQHFA